jgi:hypothetical protein
MGLDILNVGTTLFLLIALSLILYRGLNKNQTLLLRRFCLKTICLLFREISWYVEDARRG